MSFGDDTLMPGWGLHVSGSRRAPVTFGSYGSGQVALPKGIWIKGETRLVFDNLHVGPSQGINDSPAPAWTGRSATALMAST